jgi:hypothetical protein
MSVEPDPIDPTDPRQALGGLVRIAAGASIRTAAWTLDTWLRVGNRVVRAASSGESAAELLGEARGYARELLGVADLEERLRALMPDGVVPERAEPDDEPAAAADTLRDRGAALLLRSADVAAEEDAHPAYGRILEELTPDEARILRFLALEGAQPSVDVRTSKTLNVTSELVAPGLSLIGRQAGCRHLDRVPAYLNNLYRLGLLWFSRESLPDPLDYQVLEAQPDVIAALRGRGRGRTVRRSIHLTPFGEDFCQTCLPLSTAEIDALGDGDGV